MSGSLKDQLLELGLGKDKRPEQKARVRDTRPPRPAPAPPQRQPPPTPQRSASAPNARQMREIERERNARRVRLHERVEAIKLDAPEAEIKHYFSTGKRIKSIYVTEAQQGALQRGEIVIVVVQGKGRLVDGAVVESLRAIDPEARIIEGNAAPENDADPAHPVPDDLRW